MRIAALGDRETIAGFRLAGVSEARIADDRAKVEEEMKRIFETPDIAVVFITSDLYAYVRDMVSERRNMGELYPIIVEIPPMSGEMKEDPIREIVRRAVGIDMEK
jgi:vacuolar-type H+-ATPase subunit F/Vma7